LTAGPRQIWDDAPVWLEESEAIDWTGHRVWVQGRDQRRIDVRPVDEVAVAGVAAGSVRVPAGDGVLDVSLVSVPGAAASGVFTTSACASPSTLRGREALRDGRLDLLAIVSKNANVATPTAERDVDELVGALTERFGVAPENVLTSFTGVIGQPLPLRPLLEAVPLASAEMHEGGLRAVAAGILTTDPRPKLVAARVGDITVAGMVKGAGMVEPRMATMLAYLFTDAALEPEQVDRIFRRGVERTLNSLTIDSDTSTSDTAVMVATGAKPVPDADAADLADAVLGVCAALARAVVSDAEGASRLLEVVVSSGGSADACRELARKIANSPLVKAAVHGHDPNWGRVVMALGKPPAVPGHERVDWSSLRIAVLGVKTFDRGQPVSFDRGALADSMRRSATVRIEVELGEPRESAMIWASDLTEEYVRFNSVYTT
jgi:glutamate N-acetyltransferase/amino-acid N-acetyltransferase